MCIFGKNNKAWLISLKNFEKLRQSHKKNKSILVEWMQESII